MERAIRILWASVALVVLCADGARGLEVQAAVGRPFGVARVTVPLDAVGNPQAELIVSTSGFRITDPQNRVYYPAFAERRVLGVLRDLLGVPQAEMPASVTAFFLFTGDGPLQVTVHTPNPQAIVIQPQANPRLWQRLLRNWWQQYSAVARLQETGGDYPPLVETYLENMLQQRLGMQTPADRRRSSEPRTAPQESLQLIFNVEGLRYDVMRATLRGEADLGPATLPLPPEIGWADESSLSVPPDIPLENLAKYVPEDCFYIRFGSFDNYLWLKRFLEQNGGSVGRMATLRGHDALLSQRAQEQLGLKETALAELLGNQVISDIALIGRDTYLREGGALGVLFEARAPLLAGELMKQRRAAAEACKDRGVEIVEEQMGDVTVSRISTPDNRLRSFQVAVDQIHLVTTSRAIAASFIAAHRAGRSLADTAHFRQARQNYPLGNDAAAFVYLSPAFFRGLLSPQYQIELRRRLRAVTDLELVYLARLAAAHEGQPHGSVQDLIQAGLLPPRFLERPDGGAVVWSATELTDSLRGARGSFLPIPDVPLTAVTAREAREFAAIAQFHQTRWTQMDPLVVQMRRETIGEPQRERIEIDAEMLPFDRQKYGFVTSIVGPATTTSIRQSPQDAITVQVVLQGGPLNPSVEPHHLFFGIQDQEIPVQFSNETLFRILQVLRTAPAYLGAWPALGLLDRLPLGTPLEPDANGFARLPFGLWRRQMPGGFSLIGFDPQVLLSAGEVLAVEQAASPAQVRIHVVDVSQSRIKSWFAALDFQRAYQTSVGNARLLQALTQQFGVDPAAALSTAEQVLGVELLCALGGEYQLFDDPSGGRFWGSTHWPSLKQDATQPGQFAAPIMAWFRGLDAEVTLLENRVTGHATLTVEPVSEKPRNLPFFDFFRK